MVRGALCSDLLYNEEDTTLREASGLPQGVMPTPSGPRCPPYPGPIGSDPPAVNQPSPRLPKAPPRPPCVPSLLPLQEVANREWGPIWVHVPFSLQDLRQIKTDLGKLADDPDRYTEVFQGLTQSCELAWKDVMQLLNQTWTLSEKNKVLGNSQGWGGETYALSVRDRSGEERTRFPTWGQAVPMSDPNWSAEEGDKDNWQRNHVTTCIVEGLKATQAEPKPINYSKLSEVCQGERESPLAFLKRLREALRKHTPGDPKSMETR
uniref:Core shell protein Gag P30 domain-containing protein n=1 Tax=Sus scrofa TaxID=9823 RepID=A0A8D0NCS5_PIG